MAHACRHVANHFNECDRILTTTTPVALIDCFLTTCFQYHFRRNKTKRNNRKVTVKCSVAASAQLKKEYSI